jgi:hypothetical protein
MAARKMNVDKATRSEIRDQMNLLISHQTGALFTTFPSHMTALTKKHKLDKETQIM